MRENEIDHECTDEIVCPFCGLEFSDSWEYCSGEEDLGLIECDECGKHFYGSRHVSISYYTEKAQYGTCKECREEDVVLTNYHSTHGSYDDLCIKCGDMEKKRLMEKYFEEIRNSSANSKKELIQKINNLEVE